MFFVYYIKDNKNNENFVIQTYNVKISILQNLNFIMFSAMYEWKRAFAFYNNNNAKIHTYMNVCV